MSQQQQTFIEASVIAECIAKSEQKAKENGVRANYSDVFDYDRVGQDGKPNIRVGGNNNCGWLNLFFIGDGGRLPLLVRAHGKQSTGVTPVNQEDVNAINEKLKDKGFSALKPRDMAPAVSITLYDNLDVEEDGLTPKRNADGLLLDKEGKVLTDSDRSDYVIIKKALNIWFALSIKKFCDDGWIYDPSNDMPGEETSTKPDAYRATSLKRHDPLQTKFGKTAGPRSHKSLPAPIARANIRYNKDTGLIPEGVLVLDFNKPIHGDNGELQGYEPLVDEDGTPFNNFNAHKFLTKGSNIIFAEDISSVCFSSLGISIPSKVKLAVINTKKYGLAPATQQSILGLMPAPAAATPTPAAAAATPDSAAVPAAATPDPAAVSAAATPAATSTVVADEDMVDSILSGLE